MDTEDCVQGWCFKRGAWVYGVVGRMRGNGTLWKERLSYTKDYTRRQPERLRAARNEVYDAQVMVFKIITTPEFVHKSSSRHSFLLPVRSIVQSTSAMPLQLILSCLLGNTANVPSVCVLLLY